MQIEVEVKKSKIDGMGAFAKTTITKGRKIGDIRGEIISYKEARRRAATIKRITIIELEKGGAIDATHTVTPYRYINHSCSPNTYMRRAYEKCEFYALRNIKKGEELTCDYGETHHDGKLACRCGAPNCKGAL